MNFQKVSVHILNYSKLVIIKLPIIKTNLGNKDKIINVKRGKYKICKLKSHNFKINTDKWKKSL